MVYPARPIEERFWGWVKKTETCWLWTGRVDRKGYGRITLDGGLKQAGAHRCAYELLVGPIPEGLTIDHLCRVKACVNPDHLEPVTSRENHRRWADTMTHCAHGHEFTLENTYWNPSLSARRCRECKRRVDLEYIARKKLLREAS